MATIDPARIKAINVRYHNLAADEYDSRWGIDFGDVGGTQVVAKAAKAFGSSKARLGSVLEIGAGTGYLSLNLLRAGIVSSVTATDISQGMLDKLAQSAERMNLAVDCVAADAEKLPFDDSTFDSVLGHAVLHHIPDLGTALTEFHRVLKPGGTIFFCGEPSRYGHRMAGLPKRIGSTLAPLWRRALGVAADSRHGRRHGSAGERSRLERYVDVHSFTPGNLRALADMAGFVDVAVGGEELLANWYGWTVRSLEAGAEQGGLPRYWTTFAYRTYIALQTIDRAVLEPRLPVGIFYNLILTAKKPDDD